MKISPPKVQSLSLKNFTAFEKATFEFCPGINVLIGANATGKSHVMKMIYTILKVCEIANQRQISSMQEFEDIDDVIYIKLGGVFRNGIDKLIRRDSYDEDLEQGYTFINLKYEGMNIELGLGVKWPINNIFYKQNSKIVPPYSTPIYLPAQEFLSTNEGFIAAYEKRELPYDETFYDLSLALNALPLRKNKLVDIQDILDFLQIIIAGDSVEQEEIVTQENGRFTFSLPEGKVDVHLVAEGYRKIATLYYLLRNGSLSKDSILFWDEPEANLNPKLIVEVVKVLQMLAATGMQIFITTHDYLLSHELSLLAEYPAKAGIDLKFFALHRPDRTAGVQVEVGQTLAEIQHNPILAEFAAHYDRESTLFSQTTP